MDLVVVRHAVALRRTEFASTGQPDEARPLTEAGRCDMVKVARGIVAFAPRLDVLASSPLVRARETAAVVSAAYGEIGVVEIDALRPASPYEDMEEWLHLQALDAVVAVVGHEPHLSGLVSWLLAELDVPVVSLKKGSACLVRFPDEAVAGEGVLRWLLEPSQLRAVTGR